ncbi:hypothetical protein V495_00025 [Pseudogymnoascus sp. VKM F-4514 (FW-929)]|nr:hypothetical protein V495_00025 [Pseudogymnoascus sp. VKM F-4514 (FW-929)]
MITDCQPFTARPKDGEAARAAGRRYTALGCACFVSMRDSSNPSRMLDFPPGPAVSDIGCPIQNVEEGRDDTHDRDRMA